MERNERPDDLNRRIRDAKEEIKRRLRGGNQVDPTEPSYDGQLPPAEDFVPYATIFKLDLPGENPRRTVRCLSCGKQYPLKDILEGELNDDQCPSCGRWALDYWRNQAYRSP